MNDGNELKQVVKGPLSVCELDCVLLSMYRSVQQQALLKIFTVLPNHEDPTSSKETVSEEDIKTCEDLRRSQSLSPFVVGGIIRVDGRLRIAAVPYEARHPILLPCNHSVTVLVIRPDDVRYLFVLSF